MSESAISAKSAKQIFANFVKFVKSIFGTTRRSEGSVTEAEYPTNYQRISNLSLTIRPFRVAILAVLLVFVGSWNSEVLGNTATISGASFKDNRSWTGNHVKSFTISGSNSSYSSTLKALDIAANTNYTITWTKNSGCDITVTGIKCKIGNPNTWYVWNHNDLDVYINNSKVKTVGGWSSDDNVSKTGMSLGNNGSIVLKTTKDANIYSIEITYTITPNKPGVNPTTESVTVTLPANTASPTAINYKDNFSTSDHYGSYFEYAFDSNPNKKGVMSGDNFYATDSGTYKIKARIKAENNCHVESDWSYLTITVNPLDPSFTATNGSVDISVGGDIVNADLSKLVSGYDGNGTLSFSMVSVSNGGDLSKATIDGNNFSATKLGTYRLRATYAATKQYRAVSREFDVAVGKRTPTFEWWNADGKTHIYASDVLKNVAQAKYNENDVDGLSYSYSSNSAIVVVDGTSLRVQNTFVGEHDVTISVSTDSTDYYKAGSDSHTYLIEPKATPEFRLNDTINLPDDPVQELNLFIGETATMRFVNTDESNNRFTYPTNPTYVSYEHNSDAHTGVITGTVAGDEYIQFHQGGTNTIFDHLRKIHVYVNKHPVNLTTTLDGGTWKVDSIYDGAVYSIVTPTGDQPALSEVKVTSSNDAVLKKVDGHWKAVGEGEATLTITHPSTNAYWAGQTIKARITVVKHTPEFTWHIPATVNYNRSFAEPVSSTNTDEGCSFTYVSDNTAAINYVNGALRTFEKSASNVAITVTQAGNYKWAERSQTFHVNVEKLADHVPFTMNTSAVRDAVYGGKANKGKISCSEGGTITLDQNGGIVLTTANALYYDIHFSGIPNSVSFKYQQSMATSTALGKTGKSFVVYQKSENGDWSELWTSNGAKGDKSEHSVTINNDKLLPSTRYLRFFFDGTYTGYYKNISVTERTEITGVKTVDFGATDAGSNASIQNPTINWYNVNPLTLTIEGENASQFTVSPAEIASAKDAYAENVPLTISYIHNRAAVKDTATLVITDGTITKRIGLRGTTNKLTPAITWKENITPMQRGVGVKNPATSSVALTYTSSDPAVVAVIGDSIAPLKKGNATITASFDGTSDPMYNSNSSTIDVVVTDMKVQHINWTQTFTRLKYTTDPVLSSKNTQPFALEATVSYYDADAAEEVILDRPISFTSGDESVVKVIEGMLHVIGLGETTLTAHVDGIADSLFEATVIRTVKVREPSTDCEAWVLENKSGSINTISSKEFTLTGEGDSIYFEAWREPIKVVIEYSAGDLYLAEVYENGSEKLIWQNNTPKNNPASYKCSISREAKKVKFYTVVGATGYHNFSDVYVRRARYVELENTKGKTKHSVHFSTEDAKPGVAKTKSFTVNYSNITDQLEMELKGGESSKFSVVSPASKTIGTDCGEYGTVSVQVQFLSNEVESYKDTLVIHNLNQSVEVYLSAEVDKHHQQITWNPATTELKTTDAVTFDATTSAAAAGLSVRYEVVDGDAATVNAVTGALTIIKDGNVTIKATAEGNDSYHDAEPVSKTFTISKVTPTITTVPTAATMTMPNTSLADCELTGGEASVAGSFAWADNTINAIFNNTGYTVIFTPENTNWYSSVSCVVVVPVNKMIQTITWDFAELEMYPNAQVIFDASTNAGLPVSYTTSDETIAYVDGENRLRIIRGGEVTITAKQGGNETYAAAEPVSKTLTINRFAPEIVTLPNASSMKIGRVLSDASLSGGRAELNGEKVEGSFAWVDGNTTVMNVAGTFSKEIVFNPSNANLYEPVYGSMQDVSVEKYAPVITQNLHGSAITYGDALSASTLSGSLTATDYIKIPSEEVDGSYGWLQPSALLNAGTQNAIVRFTPANMDWYEAVDFPVQLTVNRASPDGLTVTGMSEILYGQILGEAVPENATANPVHGGIVAGEMNWDASLDMEEYKEIGTYNLPVTLVVNDPNYIPATLNGTAVLTVKSGFAFKGNNGTAWNDEGNWFGQEGLPGENDPVLIMSDVVVSTNVTVDAMTIRQGVKVTVADGGSLTVKNGDAVQRNAYGNLIVESGGEMEVKNGIMHVQDFTLKAKLGDGGTPGKSGQVHNPASLEVNGNAYFDLALDPSGQCSQGWYDFTVPFPVDAVNGVSRFKNDTHAEVNIRCEVNYAIMDFSESRRIETGYGWKKYHGVMQPGQCYSITIDDYDNIYRFKKTATGSFNNQLTEVLAYTDTDSDVRGWNGLGNGTMAYANLNAAGIEKVQLYNHTSNSYTAVPLSEYTYVVGSAYFVQAPSAAAEISYIHNGENHTLRAPQRTAEEVSEFALTLRDNKSAVADRLYISANEEASDGYEIGRELTKFGTPTESKVAQVWANAYDGMKLCDIEMLLENQNAVCELGIYAPQDGNYTLSVDEAPSNGILYLTYNGYAIWNLSYSPYSFELTKGCTEGYGLKLYVNAVATDIESIQGEGEQCRKIMIDNQIYIVMPNGTMYDITGKKVQ